MQDVFGGRLTAFVHNAGLMLNVTTTSAEAPANLEPDEDWNDKVYGTTLSERLSLPASEHHCDDWTSLIPDHTHMCIGGSRPRMTGSMVPLHADTLMTSTSLMILIAYSKSHRSRSPTVRIQGIICSRHAFNTWVFS